MGKEVPVFSIAPFSGVIDIKVERSLRLGLFSVVCLRYNVGWARGYRGRIHARTVENAIRKLFKKVPFIETIDTEERILNWASEAEESLKGGYTGVSYSLWY